MPFFYLKGEGGEKMVKQTYSLLQKSKNLIAYFSSTKKPKTHKKNQLTI